VHLNRTAEPVLASSARCLTKLWERSQYCCRRYTRNHASVYWNQTRSAPLSPGPARFPTSRLLLFCRPTLSQSFLLVSLSGAPRLSPETLLSDEIGLYLVARGLGRRSFIYSAADPALESGSTFRPNLCFHRNRCRTEGRAAPGSRLCRRDLLRACRFCFLRPQSLAHHPTSSSHCAGNRNLAESIL